MKFSIDQAISEKTFLYILFCIKLLGVLFATLVFSRFTPIIDSELYLKGHYVADPNLRTQIINSFAFLLNNLGGKYFAHLVFALVSSAGLIYYCLNGGRRWIFLLFLFLPSSFIWTSIVGKEAIFFGALGIVLVTWSKYAVTTLSYTNIAVVLFAMIICGLLRPHYSLTLLWLFVSAGLIRDFRNKAPPFLIAILIGCILFAYFTIWDPLLERGFGSIDPLARASRFDLLEISPNSSEGYLKFKSLMWLGMILGMLGPYPSEAITRIEFLPFFVEGLLILFFPVAIWVYVWKSKFQSKSKYLQVFWWSLVPAMIMLMILHAPFGLLNPGSATRWRTNFEPLLLLFKMRDNEGKKNTSLPF